MSVQQESENEPGAVVNDRSGRSGRNGRNGRNGRQEIATQIVSASNTSGDTTPTMKENVLRRLWHGLSHWFLANTFTPVWLPQKLRHLAIGYIVAILLQGIAVLLTALLIRMLPDFTFAGLFSLLAIALIALTWGAGPGLIAAIAGTVLLNIFIQIPHFTWSFDHPADITGVAGIMLFFLVGLAISIVASQSGRARRNAEALAITLTTERTRLNAIIEIVPDAVAIHDAAGTILQLNQAARQAIPAAYKDRELMSIPRTSGLLTMENKEFAHEDLPLSRALRGETVSSVEVRQLRDDGSIQYLSVSAAPLRNAKGEVEATVTITHDISNLRQSEREIVAHATELEAIFEAIGDGIVVFDRDRQIQHVNRAFLRMMGIEHQVKTNFSALSLIENQDTVQMRDEHGQLLPYEQWPGMRILRGEVLNDANVEDIFLHTIDGRILQINVAGSPIYDKDGQLISALYIYRDVTASRQLERRTQDALKALLEMAETLVQVPDKTTPTGELTSIRTVAYRIAGLICSVLGCKRVSISILDAKSELLLPLTVVGLSAEQERQWWEEQSQEPTAQNRDTLNTFFWKNEVLLINMKQPPFNEQPNPYDVHTVLAALMKVGNQSVGVLSLDYGSVEHHYTEEEIALASAVAKLAALVVERERLLREREEAHASELALREANRRMDEFLGMTSHELRTPLTSIKGNTQLTVRQIRNSMQNFQKMQAMLEGTEKQVRLLDRLVNDLLDISRTESGQIELHPQTENLATLAQQVVEEQQRIYPDRQITLHMAEEPLPVSIDRDRIIQVISNYLTNALKYSAEDTPVQVMVTKQDEQACVQVRDKGPGLTADEQEAIWERFHRVHGMEVQSSAYSASAGLGLGLYISKTIIEHHHGQVGVESVPDEGSTFWFTLPLTGVA